MARRSSSGAKKILDRMNRQADPCEDFYEYACGSYVENTEIPGDSFWVSTFAQTKLTENRIIAALSRRITTRDIEAVRKTKLFFRSCMCVDQVENEATQSALNYLNSVGGTWPTFDNTWVEDDFDLETSLAAAAKQDSFDFSGTSLGPFIPVAISPATSQPKPNNRVHIRYPLFLISEFSITPEVADEFEQLIIDTLVYLGADTATAQADGQAIAALELDLLMVSASSFTEQQLMTLNLVPAVNTIDWIRYLNELFEDEGITFEGDDVVITDVVYLIPFVTKLQSYDARTLANDLKWRMFVQLLPAMPDEIRERYRMFENLITGVEKLPSRRSHCAQVVNGNYYYAPTNYGMGQAVSRLFVHSYSSSAIKNKVVKIGDQMKTEYKEKIEANDWLTDQTRQYIIGKIEAHVVEPVAPNATCDDDYLNMFYRDFDIQKRQFMENHISTLLGLGRRMRETLEQEQENTWIYPPSISNAFFSPENVLTGLTAAFLQPRGTFFDLNYPEAYNFAGSGFFVAKGITFHIGSPGFRYNVDGETSGGTYSLTSLAKYAQRIGCLREQYKDFEWPFTGGVKLNTDTTWESDVSDLDGLKIAYQAYSKVLEEIQSERKLKRFPYNEEQFFFIAYAQNFCQVMRPEIATVWSQTVPFSPPTARTNGPLRNFPAFAEAFNCPVGSFMNPLPEDQCVIF